MTLPFSLPSLLPALLALLPVFLPAEEKWKVVWSDEFGKDGAPDPTKWAYEEGYVRNNEKQFYTRDRRENARVENGQLVIEARKEQIPVKRNGKPATTGITSASLITKGRACWTYGRIEARAKLPAGRGTWPAIWMLGTNMGRVGWPKCGELDIMEFVGHDPGKVHFNVHTSGFNHRKGNARGKSVSLPKASEDFHVYGLDWSPRELVFHLDGNPVFTCPNDGKGVESWPFDAPQYLILNLAIGGAWGGQQGIDDKIFPQRFLIDWVRVSQKG